MDPDFKSPHALIQLAQRGFLAGPNETEECFAKRLTTPFAISFASQAQDRVAAIYGIRPDWPHVSFSSASLSFWEGGYFISAPLPRLVLHPHLATHSTLFGLYSREEILAHELVHAARMAFCEPVYEEYLAYSTSSSSLRRVIGPLFQNQKEALAFVIGSGVLLCTLLWTQIGSLLVAGGLFSFTFALAARLFYYKKKLRKAEKALSDCLKNPMHARSALLFLTDREIGLASSDMARLRAEISMSKELRIRQLRALYPRLGLAPI